MLKEILIEIKKSCFSVLPIYFLILILLLFRVISLGGYEILSFSLSTILLIIGISLFNYGAEHAMTPIGKQVGKGLIKQGKIWLVILVVFAFGFLITIAEPDLSVLASQTKSVFPRLLLIISIGVSVGFFLLLAILKIIKKINLIRLLSVLYMLSFSLVALLAYNGKENMVALCFDSGGVTTGPMTVPFLMALGAGIATVIAQKSEKDASFGFIAFSSIGPVVVMLILSLFSTKEIDYQLANYDISNNFFEAYFRCVLDKVKEVGISIGLLFLCYMAVDLLFLHSPRKKVLKLIRGLLFAYLGLVLFLSAVDSTYMGIGFKIGQELSNANTAIILIISFAIGALTVLAEPAIKILISQVEEMTNGLVKRRDLLIALALGVGMALVLAMLRIILKFSILYIIIPGYIICFILSFFVPRIYTAIAFDAGGVASGPLTSSFILPIALGLCSAVNSANEILSYGFGIVSLVALSPLISIEVLGCYSLIANKIKQKNRIKNVLKEEDKILISFSE